MIDDVKQYTPINAWSQAHQGETFRLLAGNLRTDQNASLRAAIECFNEAIKQDLNFIWAIAHRGLVNRELGNLDDAIRDLETVMQNAPGNPWVYAQLGDTYRKKMDVSDDPDKLKDYAINNFKKAIELSPGSQYAWAHAHLGSTYCLLGNHYRRLEDWQQAKKSLETAIEQTQKSYAWAYAYLGVVELKGFNDQEKALEYHKLARILDPRVLPHDIIQLGMLYYLNGEYDKAIETYTQGLQQEADKSFALYGIAVTTVRQKGLNEARSKINQARQELERKADSFALYQLAALASLEGQADQALKYFQDATALRNKVIAEANFPLRGEFVNLANNDLSWLGMHDDEAFQSLISQAKQA